MANEDILRKRWDEIFHESAPYQTAKMQAAVQRARLKSSIDQQRTALARRGAGVREMADFMQRSRDALASTDATVRGLDDYQGGRVGDYIDQTRAGRGDELQSLGGRSAVALAPSYIQQLKEPDFAQTYPWMNVRRFALAPSAQDREKAQQANDAEREQAIAAKRAMNDKAQAEADFSYGQQVDRMRREQRLMAAMPADLRATYGQMTPREKAEIVGLPEDMAYARLSGSPLRPKPVRQAQGGGFVQPGRGGDFLESAVPPIPGVTDLGSSLPQARGKPTAELMSPNLDFLKWNPRTGY